MPCFSEKEENTRKHRKDEQRHQMSEKEWRERDNDTAVLISSTSEESEATSSVEEDNVAMPSNIYSTPGARAR